MRIALISDIHGNHIALEAVLADIRHQQTSALVCLGDVATLGPHPQQVIATLQQAGAIGVRGNHDAALLDMDRALDYQIGAHLLTTLQWCAEQLAEEDLAYLRSFAPTHEIRLAADASLLCFHGSPHASTDIILATTPPEVLDSLLAGQTATILAGGHTHLPLLRHYQGKLIVNPGSVGAAFAHAPDPSRVPSLLPWANYALLSESDGILSVELRRVPFDCALFAEAVAQSTLPIKDWWLHQYSGDAKP